MAQTQKIRHSPDYFWQLWSQNRLRRAVTF